MRTSVSEARGMRRALRGMVVGSTIMASMFASLGLAQAASPTDSRSYQGCPLLIEAEATNPQNCVQRLQNDLNRDNPGYNLDPDGKFGRLTRIAVLDFQGRHHLPADGNVGGITADALAGPTPGTSPVCDIRKGLASDGNDSCKQVDVGEQQALRSQAPVLAAKPALQRK